MGLLELVLQLLARGRNLAQVDLVEGGQHRGRVLRLHQTPGDGLAHPGHRHALFRTGACGLAHPARPGEVDDVFLGHRAAPAGAFHLGRIHAFGECGKPRARRQRGGVAGGLGCFGLGGLRCLGSLGSFLLLFLGGRLDLLLGRLGRGGLGGGAFLDHRQDLRGGDRVALLELDLLEHAIDGRGHFQDDLVGLQVHQVLVAPDRITGLLVPAGDGGVGNGFGKCRNFDFGCHAGSVLDVSSVGIGLRCSIQRRRRCRNR